MNEPDPVEAWQRFCERLAALGPELMSGAYPTSPRDLTDGIRHLATQAAGWTNWAVGHADPRTPAFFRQNDLVMRWGGPNVDQVTRRARIEPSGVYRITGQMGSCEDFICTLKSGDMHMEHYGIAREVMASELGYGPGDEVSLTISAEPGEAPEGGNWLQLPPEATMVNLREYYWDWRPQAPALFTIERLDTQGVASGPVTSAQLAASLDEAATLVESSLRYWNQWVEGERAEVAVNTFGPAAGSAGGSSRIRYSFGFFDLAPDEAWLIDIDPAGADFSDIQLYSLGWFESLDFANRTTSLNHTQLTRSGDGMVRVVVSGIDPGVPNWLDTEGRPQAMVTQRWIRCPGEPRITARVVPLSRVRDELPPDTPEVTAGERRAEIVRRQRHVAWRYRT